MAAIDATLGATKQFTDAIRKARYAPLIQRDILEMLRSRGYGILADYPDQNDHNALRSDPVYQSKYTPISASISQSHEPVPRTRSYAVEIDRNEPRAQQRVQETDKPDRVENH